MSQRFSGLLNYARRYSQPVALAMIGLDRFEQVDATHGQAVGDTVLKRLMDILSRAFPESFRENSRSSSGDDVISQWSRGQFVAGMYGMNRDDGVQRAAEVLETLRNERFEGIDGAVFRTAFSAGVSAFPLDGNDFWDLQTSAEEAMGRAKAEGGTGCSTLCQPSCQPSPRLDRLGRKASPKRSRLLTWYW